MMIVGVVAFVVALLVSVMLHEAGHFLFARRFGMKVTEFFVGFGTKLWSFRRGETEYGVKSIPAGGYVKIVGMTPLEEVDPADEPRAFYRQPAPQRLVVLAAGSVTHFIVAILLLFVVFVGVGVPGNPVAVVSTVSACVPVSDSAACSPSDPASPAKIAGLEPGDRIVSFDGTPVTSWDRLQRQLRAAGGHTVTIGIERHGRPLTVRTTLVVRSRPDLDQPSKTVQVGVLGVSPQAAHERYGPASGAVRSVETFGSATWLTLKALAAVPAGIPKLIDQTVHGKQRSADGLVGPIGVARVSGQALQGSRPLYDRVATFLFVIAGLNVTVGVFNLLPLLPMDGGHIAVLLFEQARRGVYSLRRRPDPGRVDLRKLMPAAYLVLTLLIGLSVLLLAADIVNPVSVSF